MERKEESAAKRAYDFIREQLQGREMRPGGRLVTRTIAKQLGTSLNPVREALNRLASQGLVEHIPGSGTFVPQPTERSVRDLYELREAIECYAVASAARKSSGADLAAMRAICESWQQMGARMRTNSVTRLTPEELAGWGTTEKRFHGTLVGAADNRMLSRMVEEQRTLSVLLESLCVTETQVTVDMVEHASATHTELVQAIADKNPDRAREIMASILHAARDSALAHLKNVQCGLDERSA